VLLATVVVLGTLIAYACGFYTPTGSASANAEQYLVYSSYISSRLSSTTDIASSPGRNVVICSDPISLPQKPVWKFFAGAFRGMNGHVRAAYLLFIANAFQGSNGPRRFERRFSLLQPYELVAFSDVPEIAALADERPQSAFTFSAAAFNNDLDQALFYVHHHCGSLCGEDCYILMRKINGKWAVAGQILMGVSQLKGCGR
jgi:hypothetical protein